MRPRCGPVPFGPCSGWKGGKVPVCWGSIVLVGLSDGIINNAYCLPLAASVGSYGLLQREPLADLERKNVCIGARNS